MAADARHPLGILPRGNVFMLGGVDTRSVGLGDLAVLSDELLLDILAALPARALAAAGTTSRALYCFSAHDDLWRTLALEVRAAGIIIFVCMLVLTRPLASVITMACAEHQLPVLPTQEFGGDVHFSKCWRETYIRRCGHDQWSRIARIRSAVCSDLLYQPWLCATTAARSDWLDRDNIPRISAAKLTRENFRTRFEEPNMPVIITGLVRCRCAPHAHLLPCCAVRSGEHQDGCKECPPDLNLPDNAMRHGLMRCELQVDHWPAYRKWSREQLASALGAQKLLAGEFEFSFDDYFLYADNCR